MGVQPLHGQAFASLPSSLLFFTQVSLYPVPHYPRLLDFKTVRCSSNNPVLNSLSVRKFSQTTGTMVAFGQPLYQIG